MINRSPHSILKNEKFRGTFPFSFFSIVWGLIIIAPSEIDIWRKGAYLFCRCNSAVFLCVGTGPRRILDSLYGMDRGISAYIYAPVRVHEVFLVKVAATSWNHKTTLGIGSLCTWSFKYRDLYFSVCGSHGRELIELSRGCCSLRLFKLTLSTGGDSISYRTGVITFPTRCCLLTKSWQCY